jgi:hypothetical protein
MPYPDMDGQTACRAILKFVLVENPAGFGNDSGMSGDFFIYQEL